MAKSSIEGFPYKCSGCGVHSKPVVGSFSHVRQLGNGWQEKKISEDRSVLICPKCRSPRKIQAKTPPVTPKTPAFIALCLMVFRKGKL